MDWYDEDAAAGIDGYDDTGDGGQAVSMTVPAMDTWTFARVVEAEAERLAEFVEGVERSVEQLVEAVENGDSDVFLLFGGTPEGDLDELAEKVQGLEAHTADLMEYARMLVDLHRDDTGGECRRSATDN